MTELSSVDPCAVPAPALAAAPESDFSVRKMKIAGMCLVGSIFASAMLVYGSIGLVILPMTRELGWTRTEFSFATSALQWCGALSVPLLGRLADRAGVRPVILIGTVVIGLATLGISLQTSSLWQLYACFGVLGAAGYSAIAYHKIIAALFTRHRGKALALFGMESAVAIALIPLFANVLLERFGWRGMYQIFAAVILALVPVLYFTLEEPGARQAERTPESIAPSLPGATTQDALTSRSFWLIVLAMALSFAPAMGVNTHLVAAIVDKGFSQATGAAMLSLSMFVGLVGTLLAGYLNDRLHTAKVAAPFTLIAGAGFGLICVASVAFGGLPVLIAGAGALGFGSNAIRSMAPYFLTRFFGLRSFTEIAGVQTAVSAVAMGLTPPLIGLAFERTGSYTTAFVLLAAGQLIATAMFVALGPYRFSTRGP